MHLTVQLFPGETGRHLSQRAPAHDTLMIRVEIDRARSLGARFVYFIVSRGSIDWRGETHLCGRLVRVSSHGLTGFLRPQ